MASGTIRVGIGGWTYDPWRKTLYPKEVKKAGELAYASRQFSSIEVNGTYYGAQKPESFEKWREETPDGFVFSLKGVRYATNRRDLAEGVESVGRFVSSGITRLGDKLGPLIWQFMGHKKFGDDFEVFLKALPKEADGIPLRHAVEVRHETFVNPEFVDLARRYGVATVISLHDEYPQIADLTGDFVYSRIEATSDEHELGLSDAQLDEWAERARQWAEGKSPPGLAYAGAPLSDRKEGRDVFLYVIAGFKEKNPLAAKALMSRLG